MIVGSLLLILVAVVLLVAGLVGGSSFLLIASIAASLLAAVALVVGARQAATARAAADQTTGPAGWRARDRAPATGTRVTRDRQPVGPEGPEPAEPTIPVQFVPTTVDADDSGWRQPSGPSATVPDPPATPNAGTTPSTPGAATSPGGSPGADAGPVDDEPGVQHVAPDDAARVARLGSEVLVIDGRPRYHLADCVHLLGRNPEPLPVSEAVELGFTPCADCAPDTALLADARPSY
ncbi:hypothetical protein [Micromonospora cathayae]|uniref:Uncharacterized protein n=1 Tax=Micromonospora cathayae TaxID=3028804 RepID=A0ABY7ZPB5_9ACTN|nr:hypothetical protein [Micromonospora sp. HUAS 3]WDZ84333.1 hypothetical protein PVK37_28430 [Micromonospora sp. HUAS 3]